MTLWRPSSRSENTLPHVLLQWEDFAGTNAADSWPLPGQLCTFTTIFKGTAAITTATLISAINVTAFLGAAKNRCFRFRCAGLGITTVGPIH